MLKHISFFTRLLCVLCAAVLLCVSLPIAPVQVQAATVEEEIKQLEKEQEKLKDQIADAQKDLNSSKKTWQLYTNQINNVKKQISLLDNQIASLNSQMGQKDKEILEKEAQVVANREQETEIRRMMGERLTAIAKRGNHSTLQMLLDTENYADYLIKSKVMELVMEQDQQAINSLEQKLQEIYAAEEQLKAEKENIEAQKQKIQATRASSDAKKRELDGLYQKANAAYQKDKNEVAALEKELQQTENSIRQLLASINSNGSYGGTGMYWPVPTVRAMSSPFGKRWGKLHKGIDVANGSIPIYGQNIVAAGDGTVIYANYTNEWGGGYGYYCMVDHGRNAKGVQIVTLYAHCSKLFARVGQQVVGGQTVLGQAGSSGNVTGPHLHFEVRENGVPVDPLKYVSPKR